MSDRPLPALFEVYPRLAMTIPWMPIGDWPTPVMHAKAFGAEIGVAHFHVKREDLSHATCGGNKPRGLEFLLADARAKDHASILTFSSVGSHHICRTAWHARRIGMDTTAVVVDQPMARYVRANLVFGLHAGARYVHANYLTIVPRSVHELLSHRNWRRGHPPYFIPPGGTSPRACLGHVNAALELRRQIDAGVLPEPDFVYVPMGSLGTAAGLLLGMRLAGLKSRVVGVAVSYRWYCTPGRAAQLARATLSLMRRRDPAVPEVRISARDIDVVTTALGEGYARFTESSIEWAVRMRECEGLAMDGTYGAKTLDGAMQYISKCRLQGTTHLFWHTFHALSPPESNESLASQIPVRLRHYLHDPPQPLDERLIQ